MNERPEFDLTKDTHLKMRYLMTQIYTNHCNAHSEQAIRFHESQAYALIGVAFYILDDPLLLQLANDLYSSLAWRSEFMLSQSNKLEAA